MIPTKRNRHGTALTPHGRTEARGTAQHQVSRERLPAKVEGRVTWRCPVAQCGEVMSFTNEYAEVIEFLIVHHLVSKHRYTRQQVLDYDEELGESAKEYLGFPRDTHGKVM